MGAVVGEWEYTQLFPFPCLICNRNSSSTNYILGKEREDIKKGLLVKYMLFILKLFQLQIREGMVIIKCTYISHSLILNLKNK